MQFLRKFHRSLLNLYPDNYREEYGEELHAVFNLSLDDALNGGRMEFAETISREFLSLPNAIIHEHLRERRKSSMNKTFASRFDFVPGTRSEIWAALAPFVLFGALPTLLGYFRVLDSVPLWLYIVSVLVFWSLGLFLLLIGFAKRFPRWFMPYIGLPIPIISLFLWIGVIEPRFERLPNFSSWFVSEFVIQGLLWGVMFLLVILLLVSARYVPKSRHFYQRLREDWTLLAFIIYGTIPFALFYTLNEYKNEEPYMILALLILAAGGWLYLRSEGPVKRYLYLHVGMFLSMLVAAIGKAVLAESSFPGGGGTSLSEFMYTLVTWMWLALIMLIPLALNLLPRSKGALPAAQD